MPDNRRLLLGVDGGGTKTEVWLAWSYRDDGERLEVVARTLGGPGNIKTSGLAHALNNIQLAIDKAFSESQIQPAFSDVACLCLAGASGQRDQADVKQWALDNQFAKNVIVATDSDALLDSTNISHAKSFPAATIGLVSGTGSIAWGRNENGIIARAGGWGPELGDEGSAYAIGLSGLRKAIQSAEGRQPSTLLLPAILESLQLDRADELIEWANPKGGQRERIASIAPIVFDHAPSDPAALEIVSIAAHELAAMVKSVAKSLTCNSNDFALLATGGVILGQPEFVKRITTNLERFGYPPASVELIRNPVVGALNIANAFER